MARWRSRVRRLACSCIKTSKRLDRHHPRTVVSFINRMEGGIEHFPMVVGKCSKDDYLNIYDFTMGAYQNARKKQKGKIGTRTYISCWNSHDMFFSMGTRDRSNNSYR